MLSRVADSMFWMSRYIERAENVARFIDVNLQMILDGVAPTGDGFSTGSQWEPLVITSGDHEEFRKRYGEASMENVIQFLTFDRENSNSLISSVYAARENARTIRESISQSMWEALNAFYLMVKDAAARSRFSETPHEFFSAVKNASHLFVGAAGATMARGEAWHFCRMGRLLERADKTSRIVDVKYFILLPSPQEIGTAFDDNQWAAVLKSVSALESYRRKHGNIAPEKVVEYLVLDREFPRAVFNCLDKADQSLHAISGTPVGTFGNIAEQRLGQLRSELAYLRIQEMIGGGLHEFFDGLQTKLNSIGDGIHQTFVAMPDEVTQERRNQHQSQNA